jgi:hypothetical protein
MSDSENVLVALTGGVYAAPEGTATPTSAVANLNAAFVDLGLISEDGIEEAYDDTVNEIKAWQNGQIVRRDIVGTTVTYSFTMLETTAATLELFHKGSTVESDGNGGGSMDVLPPTPDRRAFVFDYIDGDRECRDVITIGEVTERSPIMSKNDEVKAYQVTITAYPDPDNNDRTGVKFWSTLPDVGS